MVAGSVQAMKVLVTNLRSDLFRGTETFARDLANGFARRGHEVAIYSDGAIDEARPMQSEGLRVCRDLERLPFRPDIVHGQFGGDTMAALAALPDVPAIFFSHGAVRTVPLPRHPRVYRYVAMSATMALRLVVESAIDETMTDVVPNTVDLTRFATVRTPPARLRRALFYNSDHGAGGPLIAVVRQAAEAAGLTLDCAGHLFGRLVDRPEETLPGYDIVFAAGRSALEAMASGAAVIAVGMTTCGELVRPDNFDRLRRVNFAVAVNAVLPSPDDVLREIARYTPQDCAAVTRRVRTEADGEAMLSQMEAIYRKAIAAHRDSVPDPSAEQRALARYVRELAPLVSLVDQSTTADGPVPVTASSAVGLASAQLSALAPRRQPQER